MIQNDLMDPQNNILAAQLALCLRLQFPAQSDASLDLLNVLEGTKHKQVSDTWLGEASTTADFHKYQF